jgi:hypothetical protein
MAVTSVRTAFPRGVRVFIGADDTGAAARSGLRRRRLK